MDHALGKLGRSREIALVSIVTVSHGLREADSLPTDRSVSESNDVSFFTVHEAVPPFVARVRDVVQQVVCRELETSSLCHRTPGLVPSPVISRPTQRANLI